ncbi:MAG: hypothetical protein U5K72_05310 [Balneolaceae bacterium]|nr:hypothetical protein [Balneolaceae bacterium]
MFNKQFYIIISSVFMILASISKLAAQSPGEYICDKLNGEIIEKVEGRSFVGDTYKCEVEEQWDMMIMSEINSMVLEDDFFGRARAWQETFVDSENYSRRSFAFKSDNSYIVNLYVPFEKKTNHLFISQ